MGMGPTVGSAKTSVKRFLQIDAAVPALSPNGIAVARKVRMSVVCTAELEIDPAQRFQLQRRHIGAVLAMGVPLVMVPVIAVAAEPPPACPTYPVRVVRSTGGTVDYLGSVPGIPELCRLQRTGDGEGDFYLGVWRTDWPGAGQTYPAIRTAIHGPVGTRTSFVTRSVPGMQWIDSYTNEGVEALSVGGTARRALRLAHEREGIEGNTYHSIITQWKDLASGAVLKTVEQQISGRSYGPGTTWTATRIETLP